MEAKETDVLIIGGGLTGASLLLALQGSAVQGLMIDKQPLDIRHASHLDARTLALAPASVRILEQLGIGAALLQEACAIRSIHISQQGSFGNSRLHAKSEALGYVVEMNALNRMIVAALPATNILAPAQLERLNVAQQYAEIRQNGTVSRIRYRVLVAADGAQSMVRQQLGITVKKVDYQQHALVCNVALSRNHQGKAYERFSAEGPIAMLPLSGQRTAMVWAMSPKKAQALMSLSEDAFLVQLQQAFGYRLGRLLSIGQRQRFPLQMVVAQQCVQNTAVCIGSAAQHLHPVAGQGFNLALRDVATLAQCLLEKGINRRALGYYAQLRQEDRKAVCYFTNSLVRLFDVRLPGAAILRGAGLLAFDNAPFLQDTLARYARGFGGYPPDLACGLPIGGEKNEG